MELLKEKPTEEQRPYQPFRAARALLLSREPEVILAGPAGTRKSRAALEKLHLVATRYPGSRLLILRKTRKSLTSSALVTFEHKVLPARHPILSGPSRTHRSVYSYPPKDGLAGSEIDVGGLDNPTKVMSAEYDLIYVQEALELSEEEWEVLTTRLRNHVVPYQQLLGDCNPDPPSHWIKQRADKDGLAGSGGLTLLESRHEDNPELYDLRRAATLELPLKTPGARLVEHDLSRYGSEARARSEFRAVRAPEDDERNGGREVVRLD